ncbi:MAG TPA: helix-turn-helix transcriptional regulator [Thermomicrobiaceae bacterium]|nr:helix-turn-helix transcriptional regulator [Thermomicrobiaceae bacterium]
MRVENMEEGFPLWLEATLRTRGLSQAQLARELGVAETQVSRWRRGLAVPTVQSLQRLAEALAVPRTALEQLAGYPSGTPASEERGHDAALAAELHAHQALLGQLLAQRVPRELWQVYVAGCAALADALGRSFQETLRRAEDELAGAEWEPALRAGEQLGFRVPEPPEPGRRPAEAAGHE